MPVGMRVLVVSTASYCCTSIKCSDQRAMCAFLDGIAGILDAPSTSGAHHRHTKALYLEFFRIYNNADIIDQMIEITVGEWGVEGTAF